MTQLPVRALRVATPWRALVRSRPARGPVCAFIFLSLLIFPRLAPASAAAAPAEDQWSWPLDGSPSVVRGFELPTEPWLAGHRGVDLRGSPGQAVRAAGDGRVTFAGRVGGIPAVTVTHADGLRTTYQPVLGAVARGEVVARGTVLGRVSAGGSHCLPVACLHWGLRRGNSYLDPLALVGADVQVRLLAIWSDPTGLAPLGAPMLPRAETPTVLGGARSRAGSELARLGALNRARANGWTAGST